MRAYTTFGTRQRSACARLKRCRGGGVISPASQKHLTLDSPEPASSSVASFRSCDQIPQKQSSSSKQNHNSPHANLLLPEKSAIRSLKGGLMSEEEKIFNRAESTVGSSKPLECKKDQEGSLAFVSHLEEIPVRDVMSLRVWLNRIVTRLSKLQRRCSYLYFMFKTSRTIRQLRSEKRHVRHLLKYGKRAWREFTDLGVNGSFEHVLMCADRSPRRFNINQQDCRGNTILMNAVRSNNFLLVKFLMRYCEDLVCFIQNRKLDTALTIALKNGNTYAVKMLADRGAVEDAERKLLYPLHVLVGSRYFNVEALGILLEHGVNLNRRMWKVGTPLELVVSNGNRFVAYLLVALGARLLHESSSSAVIRPEKLFPISRMTFIKEFQTILIPLAYIQKHMRHSPVIGRRTIPHTDLLRVYFNILSQLTGCPTGGRYTLPSASSSPPSLFSSRKLVGQHHRFGKCTSDTVVHDVTTRELERDLKRGKGSKRRLLKNTARRLLGNTAACSAASDGCNGKVAMQDLVFSDLPPSNVIASSEPRGPKQPAIFSPNDMNRQTRGKKYVSKLQADLEYDFDDDPLLMALTYNAPLTFLEHVMASGAIDTNLRRAHRKSFAPICGKSHCKEAISRSIKKGARDKVHYTSHPESSRAIIPSPSSSGKFNGDKGLHDVCNSQRDCNTPSSCSDRVLKDAEGIQKLTYGQCETSIINREDTYNSSFPTQFKSSCSL